MRRRHFVLLALLLLSLGAIDFWFTHRKATPSAVPLGASPNESSPTPASAQPSSTGGASRFITPTATPVPTVPLAPAMTPAPPDAAALLEADKVSLMIRDYRTIAGENPVGTNAEIMAAIMGGNPKQAKLGPPEGMSLNQQGELIDRWGMPYFFHQLSKTHMEIRSAGPDKIMGTDDDVLIR